MKTFVLICLALSVWIFVFYSTLQRPKRAEPTPIPAGAISYPSSYSAPRTETPVVRQGPLVIYCGHVIQNSPGALIIQCVQNTSWVRGHYALETVWHGTEGESEIGGEFLLSGDPQEPLYQIHSKVLGVAELGPAVTYTTNIGWHRPARKLIWVNAFQVANYQPTGMPVSKPITPPPASDIVRETLGLHGTSVEKKQ
jgi:hypothetical protein